MFCLRTSAGCLRTSTSLQKRSKFHSNWKNNCCWIRSPKLALQTSFVRHKPTKSHDGRLLDETPYPPERPDESKDMKDELNKRVETFSKTIEEQKQHLAMQKQKYYHVNHESKFRGKALVIGNGKYEREIQPLFPSTQLDADLMEEVWKSLGYKVTKLYDLSGKEIHDAVTEFIGTLTPDDDSCIFYYSGHGNTVEVDRKYKDSALVYAPAGIDYTMTSGDCLVGTNGVHYFVPYLVQRFSDRELSVMRNKPKMFFLDCCRGNIAESLRRIKIESDSKRSMHDYAGSKIPDISDVLLGHATQPQHTSYSHSLQENGVYTETLARMLKENEEGLSLSSCLHNVNESLKRSGARQSANFTSYLTKEVLFVTDWIDEDQQT